MLPPKAVKCESVVVREPIYSVRVTRAYRALGVIEDDEVTGFWIGAHPERLDSPNRRRQASSRSRRVTSASSSVETAATVSGSLRSTPAFRSRRIG